MVLVVEDDPTLSSFYRSALQIAGYGVATADDGVSALRQIDDVVPAALVLDLGLPRLSGFDVGREMAAHLPLVPIVVVTGSADVLNHAEFACVLRKPITATALIEAVENCLHKDRQTPNTGADTRVRIPSDSVRAVSPEVACRVRPTIRLRRRPAAR
jgi:DNA-binding response OmpR family regulator